MSDKVMFTYTIPASGTQTIQIPYGNVAITCFGSGILYLYEGNNANGSYFILPNRSAETLILPNMCGGTFTVKEAAGEIINLCIWVYNVTGGY